MDKRGRASRLYRVDLHFLAGILFLLFLLVLGQQEVQEEGHDEACVEIKILRRVRAESSRRPPRHRRGACSMAWRCRFLTARPSQDGRVIAEK